MCARHGSQYRWNVYKGMRNSIEQNEGGLAKFSEGEANTSPLVQNCIHGPLFKMPHLPFSADRHLGEADLHLQPYCATVQHHRG